MRQGLIVAETTTTMTALEMKITKGEMLIIENIERVKLMLMINGIL